MKRLLIVAPLLVVLALILVLGRGLSLDPREVDSPLIGKPAPAFALPALHGGEELSQATLAREVSLFNVWASWCVACRAEHDILVELGRRPDIHLYGLNYKDRPEEARQWLQRHGNPYRASAMDRDGRVGLDYGVYGVPETFVVDRAGRIRGKRIGPMTWQYVNEELLPLLRQLEAESS